jgi:hypothetical protein
MWQMVVSGEHSLAIPIDVDMPTFARIVIRESQAETAVRIARTI